MHYLKLVVDGLSLLAAGATLIGWFARALPPMAAFASIFWITFQWYHSVPVKRWRDRRRHKRG